MLSLIIVALLASSPEPQQITGVIDSNCVELGALALCPQEDEDGYAALRLTVSGMPSGVLDGVAYERGRAPDYKIERMSDDHYRITIGERGLADTPFFYFTEVDFQAGKNGRLEVVRYSAANEHRCRHAPPLEYVGTVDFVAGTAAYKSRFGEDIAFDYSHVDASLRPVQDISSNRVTEILEHVHWTKSLDALCDDMAREF
jgi:hypothetical protein